MNWSITGGVFDISLFAILFAVVADAPAKWVVFIGTVFYAGKPDFQLQMRWRQQKVVSDSRRPAAWTETKWQDHAVVVKTPNVYKENGVSNLDNTSDTGTKYLWYLQTSDCDTEDLRSLERLVATAGYQKEMDFNRLSLDANASYMH